MTVQEQMLAKRRRIPDMKPERDPDRKTDWDYEAMQWREPETRVGFVQVGLCIIAAQILWLVFLS